MSQIETGVRTIKGRICSCKVLKFRIRASSHLVISEESTGIRVGTRKSSSDPFLDGSPQFIVVLATQSVGSSIERNTHDKLVFGSTHFDPQFQAVVLEKNKFGSFRKRGSKNGFLHYRYFKKPYRNRPEVHFHACIDSHSQSLRHFLYRGIAQIEWELGVQI